MQGCPWRLGSEQGLALCLDVRLSRTLPTMGFVTLVASVWGALACDAKAELAGACPTATEPLISAAWLSRLARWHLSFYCFRPINGLSAPGS